MTARTRRIGFCCLVSAIFISSSHQAALGDLFETTEGEKIKGKLIEELKDAYRVRTILGVVDLEKERIKKITRGPSPWQEYASRRKTCNTADEHYELGMWCKQEGLTRESRFELELAIEIDPEHAKARAALGHKKNAIGKWVKAPRPRKPVPQDVEELRRQKAQEKFAAKLVTEWFLKVKAIHKGRLSSKSRSTKAATKFEKGRSQILAIRDPLAIPALTGVLSTGRESVRLILVESLRQFEEDDATMNLLVMALMDPSKEVRQEAAYALKPRGDERVIFRLRDALAGKEEFLVRNAATALGILKAESAIEDLILALSVEEAGTVRVSVPIFVGYVERTFRGYYTGVHTRRVYYHPSHGVGVLGSDSLIGTATLFRQEIVDINRTEVQEALIRITGKNFGFDRTAWRNWYRDTVE